MEIMIDGKPVPNPAYVAWLSAEQRAIIVLQASLSEEVSANLVGLSRSHQIWTTLENTYSNSSVDRVQLLRDQLRQLTKGSTSVTEFGRLFKGLCDQLSAIGHPIDEQDKIHWFLCGLGASFETFSTAVRTSRNPQSLRDLIAPAEGHEMFLRSIHGNSPSPVAFTADNRPASRGRGRSRGFRGGRDRGRRPPHCQLCRRDGHFANNCPNLQLFASRSQPRGSKNEAGSRPRSV